ncbi:GNAT family protein [Aequorivita sp. Q41]|uniref:GNAT family protein n=1 Tax=Aequorivita sp. Q41 TaxID=3153300 RepID=UPI003242A8E1
MTSQNTHIKIAQSQAEFEGILSLQEQNHIENIPILEKEINGFVTLKHDFGVLKKMSSKAPQYIAINGDNVVGYVLTLVRSLKSEFPLLKPMFQEFKDITYKSFGLENYSYVISGQVCIDKDSRGLGLLSQMYQQMQVDLSTVYSLCLTEIAVTNKRSLKAHEKIGFRILHTYFDGTQDWHIVVWDWEQNRV